jgi:hypothetical protein
MIDDENFPPLKPPLLIMARRLVFVCLHSRDTVLYAIFKVSTNLVSPATQRALRYPEVLRHSLMLRDFVTPVVDVIVQNQLAFFCRQEPEALQQTIVLVAVNLGLGGDHRHHIDRDFLASRHLANDETRNAVEISGGLADVRVAKLRQPLYHAVDRLVGKILRVAESFGHKYPDQTSADYFILLPGYFGVWVKPG